MHDFTITRPPSCDICLPYMTYSCGLGKKNWAWFGNKTLQFGLKSVVLSNYLSYLCDWTSFAADEKSVPPDKGLQHASSDFLTCYVTLIFTSIMMTKSPKNSGLTNGKCQKICCDNMQNILKQWQAINAPLSLPVKGSKQVFTEQSLGV